MNLKTGDWVRTADGAEGRVRYVHVAGQTADVAIADSFDDMVTLPLGELRRIVDPRNRRAPIVGLPVERPRCATCDRSLRPVINEVRGRTAGGATTSQSLSRTFVGWNAKLGLFCTDRCALTFAGAAYRAGYRIKQGRTA